MHPLAKAYMNYAFILAPAGVSTYGKVGDQIILLVGGGTKNGQQRDIDAAIERFQQYRKK